MSVDIEKLQTDVEAKLNSEDYYSTVPIFSERKLQISKEVDEKIIYLTAKGGKSGAGIVVMMPEIGVPFPNVSGPEWSVRLQVLVLEHPTFNLEAANGTLKSAEQIACNIMATLHQWAVDNLGTLYAMPAAIRPNTDFPGLVGYEVHFFCALPQTSVAQVTKPTISAAGLNVTITNVTSGATIYITEDLTFPGPGNPGAGVVVSGESFAVEGAPATLRWAAYKTGLLGSDVGYAEVAA